jgi:hypothetical protein
MRQGGLKLEISNIEHRTSNIEHRTSNFKLRNLKPET